MRFLILESKPPQGKPESRLGGRMRGTLNTVA
jgi:hypothetical protein